MPVTEYDGHKLRLEGGATIHHTERYGENSGHWIMLKIRDQGDGVENCSVALTIDEAQKLATTLLRDVSLARFGVG